MTDDSLDKETKLTLFRENVRTDILNFHEQCRPIEGEPGNAAKAIVATGIEIASSTLGLDWTINYLRRHLEHLEENSKSVEARAIYAAKSPEEQNKILSEIISRQNDPNTSKH